MQTNQNDVKALRTTLFETIQALKREEKPMDIDRAKAICDTSQVIINTVKVEIDFAKVTGLLPESEFIPATPAKHKKIGKETPAPKIESTTSGKQPYPYGTSNPEPGVTVHRAK